MSATNIAVSVTFLDCCFWHTVYKFTNNITNLYENFGLSEKGTVFNQIFPLFCLINGIKLMKLFSIHLSELIWSIIILSLEIT